MISNDIADKITSELPSEDVIRLGIAIGDQRLALERKKREYETIFGEKMRSFWFGRFVSILYTRSLHFWSLHHPHVLSITASVRHYMSTCFRGWQVVVCGRHLHASTRVLDEIISITVDLHAPFHSVRSGDCVSFKFDIVQSSIPVDVDSYKPTGVHSGVLNAMYETLRELTEVQTGTYTNLGVVWNRHVSDRELDIMFGNKLGPEWFRCERNILPIEYPDNIYATPYTEYFYARSPDIDWSVPCSDSDGVQMRIFGFRRIHIRTRSSAVVLGLPTRIGQIGLCCTGDQPSCGRGPGGLLERQILEVLREFHEISFIWMCGGNAYSIHIKVGGKRHVFPTWNEVSRLSGISYITLKKMAVPVSGGGRGVFIDFDSNTFRRKKIMFEC